ncbi:zinc-dependent alcohol dehydrogenase family protein [Microbaculum sp. FT89]|uniref:zinc-dependent alcohol dehydrogenase family protein n=1 Tax=Microbaculum sp. FT89 TaxID=3447298 RepID=UPI003F532575
MVAELTTRHDDGALKSGQVRIDVLAATINPADLLTLEGRYGVKPKRRYVPGSECVGIVSAVADDVASCAVGDLVIPMGLGAWRERIVCDARSLIVLPEGTDIDQAAMLKANPATALVMLEEMVALSDGDWVLLNAANSAVGQNVIKLAKARGLRTAAVVRRQQAAETVRALGCDLAIVNDGTTSFQLPQGGNVRLALDAIGGRHTARLGAAVADGGTIVTYGLLSSEAPQIDAHDLVFRNVSLRGFWLARWFTESTPTHVNSVYSRLVGLLGKGEVGARVEARYPLQEFEKALAHAASSRDGKILLTSRRYQDL